MYKISKEHRDFLLNLFNEMPYKITSQPVSQQAIVLLMQLEEIADTCKVDNNDSSNDGA